MIPLATIRELFEHNHWARDRQIQTCAALTEEQFLRPMGSSFSSLRDTLAHLLGAEWVWLERWRGKSPTLEEAQEFAPDRFPTLGAIRERWGSVMSGVHDCLAGLTEEGLVCPLTYHNLKGESWTYPLWRMLFHVVNHQSYHRGQATTLLRALGAQPAPIDYLVAHDARLQILPCRPLPRRAARNQPVGATGFSARNSFPADRQASRSKRSWWLCRWS